MKILTGKGPALIRNLAANRSKGDIIIFTDADCIPEPDFVEEMIKPFSDETVIGVQGSYETLNKHNIIARYVGYEIGLRHHRMRKCMTIDHIGTFAGAYRRRIFLDSGGFDTNFKRADGEDTDLSYRLSRVGKLVYNPQAIVKHPHPHSLIKYLKQQFWRAYWRVPLYKKNKDKIKSDSYMGNELVVQAILVGIVGLSYITVFWGLFIFPIITSFILVFVQHTVWHVRWPGRTKDGSAGTDHCKYQVNSRCDGCNIWRDKMVREVNACACCGRVNFKRIECYVRWPTLSIVQCKCGFAFVLNPPTDKDITNYYTDYYAKFDDKEHT